MLLSREKVIHLGNLILKIDTPKKIPLNILNFNYRAGNIRHRCSYLSIKKIMDNVRNIHFTHTLEMHVIANITTN